MNDRVDEIEQWRLALACCPLCGDDPVDGMAQADNGGTYTDRWQIGCSPCGLWLTVYQDADDGEYPYTLITRTFNRWNKLR